MLCDHKDLIQFVASKCINILQSKWYGTFSFYGKKRAKEVFCCEPDMGN